MKVSTLIEDLIAFLRVGRCLEYNPGKCEVELVTLLSAGALKRDLVSRAPVQAGSSWSRLSLRRSLRGDKRRAAGSSGQ